MSSLSFTDIMGLAGTCRSLRLASRDPMIWGLARLSHASTFALGTLPSTIQELPAVRAVRFATQVRESIASKRHAVMRPLCTHAFAGLENLDGPSHKLVLQAYDALAQWHFDVQWCAKPTHDDCFFPHPAIYQRTINLYLSSDLSVQRVFADTASALRLAAKFLSRPSTVAETGDPSHRFYVEEDIADAPRRG